MGDVVCTLPVASALKSADPEAHITWAVDPRFAGIVECADTVDEIVRVKPSLSPASWPRFDSPFDAALDMQGLGKSALVVARARAKVKLGYHWQREGAALVSRAVRPDPSSHHIVDQYVDVARAALSELGLTNLPDRAEFGLHSPPEALASLRTKLSELGARGKFVVLNPGAGWASKRWPAASFAALGAYLQERDIAPVLIGGNAPIDHAAYDEVAGQMARPPIKLTGATSLAELVALLSLAAAHVGGDTGSTHLAAALGRPAIGLYSITRPQRSCPYGQIENCLYDPAGLAALTVEAVVAKLSL